MPIELIITNIGFIFSGLITACFGLLVYIRRPKEGAMPNVLYTWLILTGFIWLTFYCIGINAHDPLVSRASFMVAVLSALFFVPFNLHLILTISGRVEPQKRILAPLYAISGLFVIFYVFFPDTLLLPSEPQLYMPNFLVRGSLFWIQDTFFFLCFLYSLVHVYLCYYNADHALRNRLKYFLAANVIMYSLGLLPEFLLYGITVDPMAAGFIGLFNIPMAYAILKYNVIDLNLLARRALGYALSVVSVTLFILFIGNANDFVVSVVPRFPSWLLPLCSGILAVSLGLVVWKKVKEVEDLKYQFVSVVTHKFRTPLTHIKWSVENIRAATTPTERESALDAITDAREKLFQLTDMLAGLSASENSEYMYKYEPYKLQDVVTETIANVEARAHERKVTIVNQVPADLPLVFVDHQKIQFALQTLLENSLTYSYADGKIDIRAEVKKDMVILTVRDYGIGITEQDMPRLFSKFYRGNNALRAHTEGMGIGLYLSRDILQRHGGDLWAESEGMGKGSTFFLKVPLSKKEVAAQTKLAA
jgi:signal transduction histidine kinase